jgi:hypothetical protein
MSDSKIDCTGTESAVFFAGEFHSDAGRPDETDAQSPYCGGQYHG